MGLMITHHHAEPLGAEMFLRAYPDLEPSYLKYKDLFEGLWKDAIERQKNEEVIWNIGFRGQGDVPFGRMTLPMILLKTWKSHQQHHAGTI